WPQNGCPGEPVVTETAYLRTATELLSPTGNAKRPLMASNSLPWRSLHNDHLPRISRETQGSSWRVDEYAVTQDLTTVEFVDKLLRDVLALTSLGRSANA